MALDINRGSTVCRVSACSSDDLCSNENESTRWIPPVLASLLQRLVARHERLLLLSGGNEISRENLCVFSAMQVPVMSIEKYLERIFKYARCSPSAFVVAYVYIDRLTLNNPSFRLTSLNIHSLLITSVMLATKFLDDLHYNNDYFAKVGGLTLAEMNTLEVEFLFMLRFRLQVTVSVFQSYCSHFQREVSSGGGVQIERALVYISKTKDSDKSCREEGRKKQKQRLDIRYSYAECYI